MLILELSTSSLKDTENNTALRITRDSPVCWCSLAIPASPSFHKPVIFLRLNDFIRVTLIQLDYYRQLPTQLKETWASPF